MFDVEEVPIDTIYHDKSNSCSHFHVFRDSLRIYKDLLKFTLSSFSSFIVDYLLFVILMIILPHTAVFVLSANVCARVISAFYNNSLNCRLVFHTSRKMRTAIGYYEPGHYCLLLVDGRQKSSRGMFPEEMAQLFEALGCKVAYNLDGGHCSFMTFQGKTANHPYKPEHEVSDGIFITEGSK